MCVVKFKTCTIYTFVIKLEIISIPDQLYEMFTN